MQGGSLSLSLAHALPPDRGNPTCGMGASWEVNPRSAGRTHGDSLARGRRPSMDRKDYYCYYGVGWRGGLCESDEICYKTTL